MKKSDFEQILPSESQIESLFELLGQRLHKISYEDVSYRLTKVIKINQMHNYKLTPNEDEVITKNSKRILIKAMSLKSSDWYKLKYNKFRTDFPTLHWKHNPFID
jgi:hypothetical protein